MLTRACVTYRGHVQGVGFRYNVRSVASSFDVVGYVKNITDGSVELVAEGEKPELAALIEAVDSRMSGFVRERNIYWQAAAGGFKGFEIRF